MSGIAWTTPSQVEDPNLEPLRPPGQQAEFLGGLTAAVATLCAIHQRRLTGEGQHLDISKQDALASFLRGDTAHYFYDYHGAFQARAAHLVSLGPIKGPYAAGFAACRDGVIWFHEPEDYQWRAFVELMGNPAWAQEERFRDGPSRAEHWDALRPLVEEWAINYTKEEIFQAAQERRIPIYPVQTIADVVHSDQLAARGFFTTISHPQMGALTCPGAPYQLSATPWRVKRPAPLLGEHNEEVFGGRLGLAQEKLVRLREAGVI